MDGSLPHTIPQPPPKPSPYLHTRLLGQGAHSEGGCHQNCTGPGGWVQVTNQPLPRAGGTPIGLRRVENVGVPGGWAWFGHLGWALLGPCNLAAPDFSNPPETALCLPLPPHQHSQAHPHTPHPCLVSVPWSLANLGNFQVGGWPPGANPHPNLAPRVYMCGIALNKSWFSGYKEPIMHDTLGLRHNPLRQWGVGALGALTPSQQALAWVWKGQKQLIWPALQIR